MKKGKPRAFRMPKALLVGAAALAMGVGLAACSNGPSSSGTGSTGNTTSSSGSHPALWKLLPANIRAAGQITIATDPEFPPYEYYLNGKLTGFEPALLKAIVGQFGIKLNIVSAGFDELIPGVDSGRYVAAMSGISDLPSREKQVTFVDYGDYATAFVTDAANPGHVSSNALSVCGLSVSGQKGTITVPDATQLSQNCVKHGKPAVKFVQFSSSADSTLAAESGRVNAQLQDYIEAVYEAQETHGKMKVYAVPFLPKGPMGIITKIGATQLDNAFLQAVKAIQTDGAYMKIINQWKIPSAALMTPGINLNKSGKYGN